MKILSFDPERYPFHEIIADLLEVTDLSQLEMEEDKVQSDWSFYKNMEQSEYFDRLYGKLDGSTGKAFYDLYRDFIEHEISPMFAGRIYYQVKPSHRLFFKNIKGQTRFHKDTDYGHLAEEVNFLVPQTPSFDSNTLWIKSMDEEDKFQAIPMKLGEYVKFKGSVIQHGAFQNTTGRSRVSFDFRVLPVEDAPKGFSALTQSSITQSGNPIMDNAQKFELFEKG